MKTAALIGATGLIGNHILELLLNDESVEAVRVLVRRPMQVDHMKAKVLVIAFENETAFRQGIMGCDTVFVSVGTTQKKVKGDKSAYRKVDYDIPVNAAKYCAEAGCNGFLLVSSVGADSRSGNFYLKLKGEVEDTVQSYKIPSISIFRPSMLLGKRQESRPMEAAAQVISRQLSFLFPSKYKPVRAVDVARAMVSAANQNQPGSKIFHYQEMMALIS